ncbi:MAG: cell division ATP-binding protein FtsE [Flavobacteriaceae bacterium]
MPIIELINASIFQDNKSVLENVNIEVAKGDFVFLIGRTGTGKSSLIKILYGDLTLKKGIGNVVGFDLLKISQKEIPFLRRKIGVVFQDFKLLSDRNIYDNLNFVLRATGWKNKDDINKRISEVLKEVGLIEIEKKYPFELSGGEQQRTAIARALLNTPELIIADEPTGNLDPQTSNEIMEVFKRLHKQGMSVFMATHDYNMIVKFPGKIFKCDSGKVFEVIAKQNENNKK